MAICCRAHFRGLQRNSLKNVIERFRNLPTRIALSDSTANLVQILPCMDCQLNASTFKNFKTYVPSRGKLGVSTRLSSGRLH